MKTNNALNNFNKYNLNKQNVDNQIHLSVWDYELAFQYNKIFCICGCFFCENKSFVALR